MPATIGVQPFEGDAAAQILSNPDDPRRRKPARSTVPDGDARRQVQRRAYADKACAARDTSAALARRRKRVNDAAPSRVRRFSPERHQRLIL